MKESDLVKHNIELDLIESDIENNQSDLEVKPPSIIDNTIIQIEEIKELEVADDDNESDVDEKEFKKLSIDNPKFIKILNNTFIVLSAYGVFLLIVTLVADLSDYNPFPFKIQNINHWATQIGYGIFLTSYWMTNVLLLRCLVIFGYFFFTLSLFLNDTTPFMDTLCWTYIFVMINVKQIIQLLYDSRPIVLDPYREKIYDNIFKGIMKKSDFKILTKSALLRDLQKDRYYSKIGDKCSNLSILIFGKMKVIRSERDEKEEGNTEKHMYIEDNEFIDSSQWMLRKNRNKGKRFSYTIMAYSDCKYLTWPREILQEVLENHPDLEQPLLGVLGLDVSHKVLAL